MFLGLKTSNIEKPFLEPTAIASPSRTGVGNIAFSGSKRAQISRKDALKIL
jgi:hypothetical protein